MPGTGDREESEVPERQELTAREGAGSPPLLDAQDETCPPRGVLVPGRGTGGFWELLLTGFMGLKQQLVCETSVWE